MITYEATELANQIIEECKNNHVGLWVIVWEIQEQGSITDEDTIKNMTLDIVLLLLDAGGIVAGHPSETGRDFVEWDSTTSQTLSRIDREWKELGHLPSIGDIVWFTDKREC